MLQTAVIFGGVSNENEISVITGTMAANILKSAGYGVLPVYISQSGEIYCHQDLADISAFKNEKFSLCPRAAIADGGVYIFNRRSRVKKFVKVYCALNCCHGGAGEGGGVSGLLRIAGIPLAGADIAESAVFMDKYLTKLVLASLGVKTAKYVYIRSAEELAAAALPPFPVIVKPASLGSSIGVEKAASREELERAAACAFLYDDGVIIEEYLGNRREINCAVYSVGGKTVVSECEEAVSAGDILSFGDKYEGGGKSVIPADIPAEISEKIKSVTRAVYSALNMRGIARFDFIWAGDVYLSEVNTVPGSLSYYLLSGGFKDFAGVLTDIIEDAVKRDKSGRKKLLKTGILENIPSNACKTGVK